MMKINILHGAGAARSCVASSDGSNAPAPSASWKPVTMVGLVSRFRALEARLSEMAGEVDADADRRIRAMIDAAAPGSLAMGGD